MHFLHKHSCTLMHAYEVMNSIESNELFVTKHIQKLYNDLAYILRCVLHFNFKIKTLSLKFQNEAAKERGKILSQIDSLISIY